MAEIHDELERLGEALYKTQFPGGSERNPWLSLNHEYRNDYCDQAAELLKTHAIIPRADHPVLGNSDVQLYLDGDKWCALIGENLQVGESGWGDTPQEALSDLLKRYDVTPKTQAWPTEDDPLKARLLAYGFSDSEGRPLGGSTESRALVRKAQMVDAMNKDLVALAEQCAELRAVAAAVAMYRFDIVKHIPKLEEAVREPLDRWLELTTPKAATE